MNRPARDVIGWLAIGVALLALAVSLMDDCEAPSSMSPQKDYPPGYAAPALRPDGEAMDVPAPACK